MQRFDLIVIGSGSAARDAARKASDEHGARVAMIERERWGGSCPNVACKPTKAYVVAADLIRDLRTLGPKLGIDAPTHFDLARIHAWKQTLLKPQDRWRAELAERHETFEGAASFADTRTVVAGGQELSAERVLVATGSRTAVPDIPGLAPDWLEHVTALDLDVLPSSLLVLGGGPVGLELAQIFRRFGADVTIVQSAPRISPRSDADATDVLTAALEDEGIVVRTGASVARFDDGRAQLTTGEEIEAERVLVASGRVPNTEELGLEGVGVRTDRGAIVVNDRMRTSVDGIWAAGDVTGRWQFTPIAQYQARIAVDDMFGANGRSADYSAVPTAIFTDPELGSVGLTEFDARERGLDIVTAVHPISSVTRAQYVAEKHGLYKLVYDRVSRVVLGTHVVSRNASDVVQAFALALGRGVTVDDVAAAHHVYPSWGEGVKGAAEQARPEPLARSLT